jgi:phage terminase Nu1 subunit (DNA packaging protein)
MVGERIDRKAPTTVKARNRLLKEQAEYTRLKNARLSGELVDAKTVQNQWLSCIVRLRAAPWTVARKILFLVFGSHPESPKYLPTNMPGS